MYIIKAFVPPQHFVNLNLTNILSDLFTPLIMHEHTHTVYVIHTHVINATNDITC